MTDATWFRLLVRAIGMLLLGLGLPYLFWHLSSLLVHLTQPSEGRVAGIVLSSAPAMVGYLIQTLMGFYLLHGGGALTEWCIRRAANVDANAR